MTTIVRPWKSRCIQPLVVIALAVWPNIIFWIAGTFPWQLAVATVGPAAWLSWRLATSKAVVDQDGSLLVRAVRRTHHFPPGTVDVEVGESNTFFSFMPQPCLRLVGDERAWAFWSISDTSDRRVERWIGDLRNALSVPREYTKRQPGTS